MPTFHLHGYPVELQKKDFKQKKDMSVEREILNRTETIMVGI